GRPAGRQGGVPGSGERGGVGVVTIPEPGAAVGEAPEAPADEEVLPAGQVVAAHLVEHQKDDEPGPAGPRPRGRRWGRRGGGRGRRRWGGRAAGRGGQGQEEENAKPPGRLCHRRLPPENACDWKATPPGARVHPAPPAGGAVRPRPVIARPVSRRSASGRCPP